MMTEEGQVTSICVGCGICCDGTLFGSVTVHEPDRLEPLRQAGIRLLTVDGRMSFNQACPAFGNGCCAIYDDRPAACRRYRCDLLTALEADELDRSAAVEVISRAVQLRDLIRSQLNDFLDHSRPEPLARLYRMMHDKFEAAEDPASEKRKHSELLLNIASLQVLIDKHLKKKDVDDGPSGR